jgi:small-conductance mechanosensitive channel
MRELAILEIAVVKLIAVALVLFAILWLLKLVLKNTPLRKSVRGRVERIMPLVEGIVWLGFMLWCIGQLVRNEIWTSIGVLVIIILIVILLFWLVIRDYLAGIVLKIDGTVKKNDWIKVKDIEGKITELGSRTMTIMTTSGETVNVPYSTISGEISARPNPGEELINHSFELKLSKISDAESTITDLNRGILNAPWSSVNKNPEIKLISDDSGYYTFEINIFSLRMVYFQKIKDYLNEFLVKSGYRVE